MENNKENKFERILNAAIKVIGNKGFHNAKIKDIAVEADVADGTIYNYFQNKEDILVTIFKIKLEEYVNNAKKEIANIIDPKEKLKVLIKYHVKIMTDNPDLAKVLQIELRQPHVELRVKVRKNLRNYFRVIEEVIEEGKKNNIFSPELDVYLAREMFFGTLDEVISTWVFTGMSRDLTLYIDKIYDMFLKAFN
ncbi:transcriptional regulator, TetR family [Deferribacter desulfuricans SSM1]|uniref:Transcriptional regulator, TetR family n=1 Tax=Deferribacter desulfuricans (strain DSM 14783 / JCM 11476 / NBRC 101012 / SSM1) TaxID=639282 RepID=D3PDS6_DEFDS|nr:TetR/AcrR family transcriptional regulator [Deferribacter desulfuricans]BAI80749.1 transcriptional regulator, TetR family [Deferribacter desulfuricans SSM1]